jgi:hypothetical protein
MISAPVQRRHLLAERHERCGYAVELHLFDASCCATDGSRGMQEIIASVDGKYFLGQLALPHHSRVYVETDELLHKITAGSAFRSQTAGESVAEHGGEAGGEEGVVAADAAVAAARVLEAGGGGGGGWHRFCMSAWTANAWSKAGRGKGAGWSARGTCTKSQALPLTLRWREAALGVFGCNVEVLGGDLIIAPLAAHLHATRQIQAQHYTHTSRNRNESSISYECRIK